MRSQTLAVYLRESLDELDRALLHLQYSANACSEFVSTGPPATEEVLARIEAFTSRFARGWLT